MSDGATVTLKVDGQEVTVPKGTTIFDAARKLGIEVPTLCHRQHQTPVGVCRVCIVDVTQNGRKGRPPASCVREAEEGMDVETQSEDIVGVRNTLYEMLMADHPEGGCSPIAK